MKNKFIFLVLLILMALCTSGPAYSRPVEAHELIDIWSSRRPLSQFKHENTNAIVLVFMLRQCPVVNLYLPRIKDMEAQYRAKGIQFLAIYSAPDENLNTIAIHGHDNDLAFPVLKDAKRTLADALGVERSSEVVVLDRDFQVRYQGAIDDQYRAGGRLDEPDHHYLKNALDAVLNDTQISTPRTTASGCLFGREDAEPEFLDVTYSKDVAPITQKKCAGCHRPGQVGPFSLLTYRDVKRFASMIDEVINDRRMPPWHAVTNEERFGHFANDRRLTENEIAIITS